MPISQNDEEFEKFIKGLLPEYEWQGVSYYICTDITQLIPKICVLPIHFKYGAVVKASQCFSRDREKILNLDIKLEHPAQDLVRTNARVYALKMALKVANALNNRVGERATVRIDDLSVKLAEEKLNLYETELQELRNRKGEWD